MESLEGVPSLSLGGVARESGKGAGRNGSNGNADAGSERDGGRGETGNSKSSSEVRDAAKDEGSLSASSSSSCGASRKDRRLKRHHPGRSDNFESNAFETNDSSTLPDSMRSSARGTTAAPADRHPPIPRDRSHEAEISSKGRERCLESAVRETILAENKRLKEVLARERRHHSREKNRIREVLVAIDEALSTLPSRLGKIRVQNQKNLMKMNALPAECRDRGDFVGNRPDRSEGDETSARVSEDVFSDARNASLFEKIESLNDLVEGMKKGRAAPIEDVLDNELRAISLLKNEIKHTRRKIDERSKTDSESVVAADWEAGNGEIPRSRARSPKADSEDVRELEKFIRLQKDAINMLSLQVEKTRELCVNEMEQKERFRSEKKALISEITKLKNREENRRWRTGSGDAASAARPFRTIKELKRQLEEKEKSLSNFKAKISRLEAAASNKGTLLDSERKRTEELESRLKILSSENRSFSMQVNSLQYVNKELKEQMDVLKSQIEILIEKNAELSAEIADMLKKEDARARATEEEAERKLMEQRSQHSREMDALKARLERCEKMNVEYLRTLEGLVSHLHNFRREKDSRRRGGNSRGKAGEVQGVTELEPGNLFGGNLSNAGPTQELQDLHDRCCSFVSGGGGGDREFSLKLSAWLFDLVKQKIADQNFSESPSDD